MFFYFRGLWLGFSGWNLKELNCVRMGATKQFNSSFLELKHVLVLSSENVVLKDRLLFSYRETINIESRFVAELRRH